jgi:hypothetical protein
VYLLAPAAIHIPTSNLTLAVNLEDLSTQSTKILLETRFAHVCL